MLKPFIRVLSFFAKELAEVRRQPRLLLSLVLGPFLILLLFGVGFTGEQPKLQALLVVAPDQINDPRVQTLRQTINAANFEVVDVMSDEQQAVQRLLQSRGAIDVVEVMPPDADQLLGRQQQSPVKIIYNEINPTQAQWIIYLSYVQIKELNTALVVSAVSGGRQQIGNTTQFVDNARRELQQVEAGLIAAENPQAQQALDRLRSNSALLAAGLALSGDANAAQGAQQDVQTLQRSLDQLDSAIERGEVSEQRQRISEINQQLGRISQVAGQIKAVPPEVLVSPLAQTPQNLAQQEPNFIDYYTPGVLALLLQHLAVTLAALSLVRETLLGSTELFRVAPVSSLQILIGKYTGFLLFAGLIMAALTALLVANIPLGNTGWTLGLGVPFVGSWPWYVAVTLLIAIASLGLGFLISAVSKSESQAVQLSMIALLGSVFFSGFFLPLENFAPFVRYIADLLPVTHGVRAFQDVMLRGEPPQTITLIWLGGIALVCFLLSWNIWRRQLRRR